MGVVLNVAATVGVGVPLLAYLLQDRLICYPQPLSEVRPADVETNSPKGQNMFAQACDGIKAHQ